MTNCLKTGDEGKRRVTKNPTATKLEAPAKGSDNARIKERRRPTAW